MLKTSVEVVHSIFIKEVSVFIILCHWIEQNPDKDNMTSAIHLCDGYFDNNHGQRSLPPPSPTSLAIATWWHLSLKMSPAQSSMNGIDILSSEKGDFTRSHQKFYGLLLLPTPPHPTTPPPPHLHHYHKKQGKQLLTT